MSTKKITTALISVFNKEGLAPIVKKLHENDIKIYSTGGTEDFIKKLDIPVISIESVTSYPSILGGRVKTLHPKIFGGILRRDEVDKDVAEMKAYEIPAFDCVIVDLYPFEETVKSTTDEKEIIEKIDIGGISLIRAAAKNYKEVLCISSISQYQEFETHLNTQGAETSLVQRKKHAAKAFAISSHYDTQIFNYLNQEEEALRLSADDAFGLRYGENPHQKGVFYGDLAAMFEQLNGKDISYNNLLDLDAAVNLMHEFKEETPTFAILKHNNACGLAQRETLKEAYLDALAGDPTSAFGGVLISNKTIDVPTATEIDSLFFEIIVAPDFDEESLEILKRKKNRIILRQKPCELPKQIYRTALNGILSQEKDLVMEEIEEMKLVTDKKPSSTELEDLAFALKICKHTKSNTIVLAKNKQLIASGVGQTSRVDALRQALKKAQTFKFSTDNAVMASDAFFPFPDCVEIASKEGIKSVVQPGGSIKDKLSIAYCNQHQIAMVFTGVRHFKH